MSLGIIAASHVPFAGGFAPTDIANLVLWLDASDSSTITHSSGAVSAWADKSTSGLDVVQSTAAAKPTTGTTTLNSLNVLRFDGGDALAYTAGSTGINCGNLTIFWTGYQTTDAVGVGFLTMGPSGGNDYDSGSGFTLDSDDGSWYGIINRNGNSQAKVTSGGGWNMPASTLTATLNSSHVAQLYRNGVAGNGPRTGSATTYGDADAVVVGARWLSGAVSSSTYRLNGAVAEIIVYEAVLSVADMNTVGNYLASKWGLTWTTIT